jgi:RHS repeat-associated protein
VTTTFVYDGDGNRIKKTVGSTVTTYVNKYYEKTGTEVTTNYYLGSKLIAVRKGTTSSYILQDHLGSTSGTADSSGAVASTISYFPFGVSRNSTGNLPTDKLFTSQILDSTGLYYYNARYYDPSIGRFISPDTIVPNPMNPQSLNRYSYCLNNPLKYIDPTGLFEEGELDSIGISEGSVDENTLNQLLAGEVGDVVIIDGQAYTFYHEAQYDGDNTGVLKLLTNDCSSESVLDVLNNSNSGLKAIQIFLSRLTNIYNNEGQIIGSS